VLSIKVASALCSVYDIDVSIYIYI